MLLKEKKREKTKESISQKSFLRQRPKFEADIKVNFFYLVQSSYIGIDRKSFDQILHSGREFLFISI